MDVRQSDRHRVGRIVRGWLPEAEEPTDHESDLLFFRSSVSDN